MALHVLLADQSPMIQKIFKWSLQDYGVELSTLSMESDVLISVRELKPDLIFLDVILKNKNGYDLSHAIKSQKDLTSLPIVLLWTHFVKLDEAKFQSSLADRHLEKPFSVESLRRVVQELVPKTKTQPISKFLTFPKLEGLENFNQQSFSPESETPQEPQVKEIKEKQEEKSLPQFSQDADGSVALESSDAEEENLLSLEEEEDWVQKNVFKEEESFSLLDDKGEEKAFFPEEEKEKEEFSPLSLQLGEEDKKAVLMEEDSPLNPRKTLFSKELGKKEREEKSKEGQTSNLNPQVSEDVIYRQSQKIIESIAWQIIPELASQVIEKEIKRLLEEKDQDF